MNRMIVKYIVKRHVIRKVTKMLALLACLVRPAVVTLTNENFTDFIQNSSLPIFLKLWATWCPHCKEFAPVWDELGTLEEFYDQLYIADIECESNRESCKALEGRNFPRLYWIEPYNQSLTSYTGERSLEHFRMFIKKQMNFPMVTVDESEIPEYTNTANVTTVFVFHIPENDEKSLAVARSIASKYRSFESRFLLHLVTSQEARLVAHTNIDRSEEFTGSWTFEDISSFVVLKSLPFMVVITSYVMHHLSQENINTFIILSNVSKEFPAETVQIAETMSHTWPVTQTNCEIAPWFCRYVGVDIHTESLHYLVYSRKRRLFWLMEESNQSVEDVIAWAEKVNRGEILPKGPGDGTFSSIVAAYYDQRAQGNPTFVFFIGPTIILIAIGFLVYDLCTSPKPSKKKKRE